MNYITEQIKISVPLPEAIEMYTGDRLSKNKMRCPFHNEKTASFTVYENDTFYCFGCGVSGDVIRFVQMFFNIDFKAAVMRLDCDYNLGLTKPPPKFSEYRKQRKEAAERKAQQEQRRKQEQQIIIWYWKAFDRVLEYEQAIERYRPSSSEDEPHPLFIQALQNIEYARHLLDCAENERRQFIN